LNRLPGGRTRNHPAPTPVPPSRNDESGDARFSPPDVSISSARCAEVQLTSSTDAGARASANPLLETERRSRGDPVSRSEALSHVRLIDRRLIERIRFSSPLIRRNRGTACVTISHEQVVIGGERGGAGGTPMCSRDKVAALFHEDSAAARPLFSQRHVASVKTLDAQKCPATVSLSLSLSLSLCLSGSVRACE